MGDGSRLYSHEKKWIRLGQRSRERQTPEAFSVVTGQMAVKWVLVTQLLLWFGFAINVSLGNISETFH